MKKIIFYLLLLMVLSFSVTVGATNLTARSFGMGGAFTGLADDLSSILYNPAGLSQSGIVGLDVEVGLLSPDYGEYEDFMKVPNKLDDEYLTEHPAAIIPDFTMEGQAMVGANLGSFGVAYSSNAIGKSEGNGVNEADFTLTNLNTGSLVLGRKMKNPPLKFIDLAYGVNLKLYQMKKHSYIVENDSVHEDDLKGNGYDIDLGFLASVTDRLKFGVQLRNVFSSDVDLKGTRTFYDYVYSPDGGELKEIDEDGSKKDKEKMYRAMRVGASFDVPLIGLTLAADIDNFPLLSETDDDPVYYLGLEKDLFFNGLSLRAGTFSQQKGSNYTTLGLGLNLTGFSLDAAVGSSDSFKSNGTVLLSGSMKF